LFRGRRLLRSNLANQEGTQIISYPLYDSFVLLGPMYLNDDMLVGGEYFKDNIHAFICVPLQLVALELFELLLDEFNVCSRYLELNLVLDW
jgi:hypothetical protein